MRRLKEAYILKKGNLWTIADKKLFKTRSENLMVTSSMIAKGLLYDVVTLRNGNSEQSFYVTKEWAGQCRRLTGEPTLASVARITTASS